MNRVEREVQMASLSPVMEEVLASGGSVDLTVTGNSMYPMLRHRVSRVRLAAPRPLQVGDLPLYRRDNGCFVLHRVVAVENGLYTCCGDHQWRRETGLRQDQILAVVTDFCRKTRWISAQSAAYSAYWRFWLAITPLRKFTLRALNWLKRKISPM